MTLANINTAEYWNAVYREESATGRVSHADYHRNYGPIHEAILGLIPDGSRVLDIACGPGLLCRKIRQRLLSTQVMGVDFSGYMISENAARDRSLGIDYRCLDIRTALGGIDGGFDVVTMCEILEHVEEPEALVAAAMALVTSGGRFILTCPHDDCVPDREHVRLWGHDDLFHLLAPYSDTVTFMHFAPPYFHVWMLAHLTKAAGGERDPE